MPKDLCESIEEATQKLNLPEIDYEQTLAAKLDIVHAFFARKGHKQLKACCSC